MAGWRRTAPALLDAYEWAPLGLIPLVAGEKLPAPSGGVAWKTFGDPLGVIVQIFGVRPPSPLPTVARLADSPSERHARAKTCCNTGRAASRASSSPWNFSHHQEQQRRGQERLRAEVVDPPFGVRLEITGVDCSDYIAT